MAREKVECPECENEYENLGNHWYHNESHRPKLTDHQKEVITGLMMGDGSLDRSSKNPRIVVKMITKEYLEELDEIFGCLSTGVRLSRTAKELAKDHRERGFNPNADEENYHDCWRWTTRSLPELHEFNWYTVSENEKVWPDNIELTPTVLTHWYVGDGNWNNSRSQNNIQISTKNEIGNVDKINSYFERVNLPSPSNYSKFENGENYNIGMNITFTLDQSQTLWDYMDLPPNGFEYKFPEEYR